MVCQIPKQVYRAVAKYMIISANIIKIWIEPAYVQDSVIEVRDEEHKLSLILNKIEGLPSFYKNHYVLETSDGLFIGYNDGIISVSNRMTSISNKSIEVDIMVLLKL